MDTTLSAPTIDIRERISMAVIHALAQGIAERFHPHKIILFGSYAYGNPRPESEVVWIANFSHSSYGKSL
jgi:predicted nucleotidyltransferase